MIGRVPFLGMQGSLLLLALLPARGGAQFQSLYVPSAGGYACGLTSTGRLYCWGSNRNGELGIGRVGGHRASPTAVALPRPVQAVALGTEYACALQDGRPYCWGTNEHGELGDSSHVAARGTPRPVSGTRRFRSLTASYGFTCGIAMSGETYCWGLTQEGQLGAGIISDSTQGALRVSGDLRFRALRAGSGETVCGITEANMTYCWGALVHDTAGPITAVPVGVDSSPTFQDVSVGAGYVCGLTTDSLAYCWGYNEQGSVGDGTPLRTRSSSTPRWVPTPSLVAGGVRFTSISAGFRSACALDANGHAYCWGWNDDGQIGDGTTITRPSPTPVSGGYVFREIHAGGATTCGITMDGQTMCWGRGADGELGTGATPERSLEPVHVRAPSP